MLYTAPERRVAFEGCFNFRDLGGYEASDGRTVRWRRLFRSDALHHMTMADASCARQELGIRSVFDLRAFNELQRDRLGPLVSDGVVHYHLPMVDEVLYSSEKKSDGDPFATADEYVHILEQGAERVARVVRLLATDVYPAVFHCAAGKDRTGIVAAVVLSLLGVSEEQIAEDYATTSLYIGQIVERMRTLPGYRETVRDLPAELFRARPETMVQFLGRVRAKYGSAEGFVEKQGVEAGTIRRMQGQLLE